MKIILASSSPRRKDILNEHKYDFEVIVKEVDETFDENLSVEDNVLSLGLKKAQAVSQDHYDDIVIGCDTIVVLNNVVYGKPMDEKDAFNTLRSLRGKTHQVISGVGIVYKDQVYNFLEVSNVTFKELTDDDIRKYIETKEPFGKAGSYAIQGIGNKLVKEYTGDINNIIGLPINGVKKILNYLLGK